MCTLVTLQGWGCATGTPCARHGDPLPAFYGSRGYSQELYSSGYFRVCANPVCTEVSGCYSGLKEASEV